MQTPTSLVLLLIVLFNVTWSRHVDTNSRTEQDTTHGKIPTDISSLEEALTALNDLTLAQKQVREQQETHRAKMHTMFTQFTEKEQERFTALEAEQTLLSETRGKISRQLKILANKTNGQSNCNGYSTTNIPPKDCAAVYLDGSDTSGMYKVWPTWIENGRSIPVFCDMDTDGGGWTVIHRFENSKISKDYFKRNREEYVTGFGDPSKSFWLGAEKMHKLTNQGSYELRFDIQDRDGKKSSSVYKSFRIGDKNELYTAHVEGFDASDTADDLFSSSDGKILSHGSQMCRNNYNLGRYVWWFSSECEVHPTLRLKSSNSSVEMKVRPVQFIRMKEALGI